MNGGKIRLVVGIVINMTHALANYVDSYGNSEACFRRHRITMFLINTGGKNLLASLPMSIFK